MLEYPEGVGRVTEAERVIDIEVFVGAAEGFAETPPVFAKVTGKSGPNTSKRVPAISEALSVPALSRKRNWFRFYCPTLLIDVIVKFIRMNLKFIFHPYLSVGICRRVFCDFLRISSRNRDSRQERPSSGWRRSGY